MQIIITGISGFVGRNLSKYLVENSHAVEGLSLRNKNWILDENADAIIHLAGKAHDTNDVSEEKSYFEINTDLTIAIFQKFLDSKIKDFFYFSSVKAAADTVEDFLREDHEANPQTPYGKSKLEAENYLLNQNLPAGKRLFIIRPCMIHGPGNKGNLNLLYNIVQKGIPWPLASFHNQRSFLSVDNLNFLILKMLESTDLTTGIYNFADDEQLSTNDVVNIIANVSHKKVKFWKLNTQLIIKLAKIGDIFKLPLNSERLNKLTENYKVSNSKIKKELGLKMLPLSAVEGLRRTIKCFRN